MEIGSSMVLISKKSKKESKVHQKSQAYHVIKRAGDIGISLLALICTSPIFLILAIIIYVQDRGPVFFAHERIGQHGKKIKIWKFRTMYVGADKLLESLSEEQLEEYHKNFKLDNDPRITPIGNFLRKASLDELPQLVNVLKGELSLVGPRPIVEAELAKYDGLASKFLSVKPGLTGYWQANGRSLVDYDNGRQEMELYYVDHQSWWLDVKIMVKTVSSVLKQDGAQ